MNTAHNVTTGIESKEANVTRRFAAPRSLVFEAWSKPELLSRWFGPKDLTMHDLQIDFRPGGVFSFAFRGPDGTEYPRASGKYVEIVPGERIVWTSGFPVGPSDDQLHTTVTFADCEGGTEVRVRQVMSPVTPETAPFAEGMQQGWDETIDRLGEFLSAR